MRYTLDEVHGTGHERRGAGDSNRKIREPEREARAISCDVGPNVSVSQEEP